jgi:hypothetical protein
VTDSDNSFDSEFGEFEQAPAAVADPDPVPDELSVDHLMRPLVPLSQSAHGLTCGSIEGLAAALLPIDTSVDDIPSETPVILPGFNPHSVLSSIRLTTGQSADQTLDDPRIEDRYKEVGDRFYLHPQRTGVDPTHQLLAQLYNDQ